MQKKTIAMMLAAGCAIGMLTGCGIPEEEHNAMIAQLKDERQKSEDSLNGKIADLESVVKSEKAKLRTKTIELDDASERIKSLQQKNAETEKELAGEKIKVSGLERDLASSKRATLTAQDKAQAAENKLATLDVEHQELKRRFEQFEKNMRALNAPPVQRTTAAAAPAADDGLAAFGEPVAAPKTDAEEALDILNQMGTK